MALTKKQIRARENRAAIRAIGAPYVSNGEQPTRNDVAQMCELIKLIPPTDRRKVEQLYLEVRGICAYCGARMYIAAGASHYGGEPKPYLATVDHIKPRANGGTRAAENSIACCQKCNHEKGNKCAQGFQPQRIDAHLSD